MRFIPTRVHGMMDYVFGILLIAAPWLFGFARGGSETWLPVILGAGILLYSLFTDYELGAVRKLSMSTHLGLDLAGGLLLGVSPWLFGFADAVWVPHVVLAAIELLTALSTEKTPSYRKGTTTTGA